MEDDHPIPEPGKLLRLLFTHWRSPVRLGAGYCQFISPRQTCPDIVVAFAQPDPSPLEEQALYYVSPASNPPTLPTPVSKR